MIYITLTNHCIEQIKKRTNNKHSPEEFWIKVFTGLIMKWEYDWKKSIISYERDWKYKITNWNHCFIFQKPFKIEFVLITYIKHETTYIKWRGKVLWWWFKLH